MNVAVVDSGGNLVASRRETRQFEDGIQLMHLNYLLTQRLVNTRLPPGLKLGAGWDACIASLGRPAAQDRIEALMTHGFNKLGDV
jgi:hypothetical protein